MFESASYKHGESWPAPSAVTGPVLRSDKSLSFGAIQYQLMGIRRSDEKASVLVGG